MNDHLSDMLKDQASAMTECLVAGMRAQRAVEEIRLKGLRSAYERAKADPQAKIPSYLMAVIEELLR